MAPATDKDRVVLECVVNVSEGRRHDVLGRLDRAVPETAFLDRHSCTHHNRSVFTLLGEEAPRRLARAAVEELDLRTHDGVHPRLGVVDVVPFVPLDEATAADALAARDRFARWAADELDLPCFLYGPERTLPEVRRGAFTALEPDLGPLTPHATAGAVAVGARPVLVAYNLWLADDDLAAAKHIAAGLRGPAVRALGLSVGDRVQVSMNLIDPARVGPAQVWDLVAGETRIERAELVGLVPTAVLTATPQERWTQLALSPAVTIEARRRQRAAGADPA